MNAKPFYTEAEENIIFKAIIIIVVFLACLAILQIEQPQVVVEDGMVVEVNGKPTYREIGKWDRLEANIIYK